MSLFKWICAYDAAIDTYIHSIVHLSMYLIAGFLN